MQERVMMWQVIAHNASEFEYRELAGQIIEQQFLRKNAMDYYYLYTIRFVLTSRTQWCKFYYQNVAQNKLKCVIHLFYLKMRTTWLSLNIG
jgi:hypothetical protein